MAIITVAGLKLIQRFEGVRLTAYRDVVGVLTIGFGHTGPDVTEGLTITQEQAEDLLRRDVKRFEQGVESLVARPASPPQFDAMVSLAFNIGLNAFKESTVLKRFNAGDIHGAAEAFILWIKGKGVIYEGLVRRRAAEIVRFMSAQP